MKRNLLVFFMIIALVVGAISGCSGGEVSVEQPDDSVAQQEDSRYPMVIVDGLGYEIEIKTQPETIVSIAPSQTEILYALGLGDKLAAVSDYCDYPAEAQTKDKVGSSWSTNTERIIEIYPDLVLVYGEGQPEAVEQLKAAGITVVKFMPETIQEILDTIAAIGFITNEDEQAQAVIKEMEEKRDNIIAKVKDQPTRRVFYQIWDEPLRTAGPGSFIDDLIRLAGGENIAADAEGAYPQFSTESLVERDPEVYLAPAHTSDKDFLTEEEELNLINAIKSRPGFSEISAAKNDKIELLEPNIVSRPGARIIEAFELIAKAIHPEVF
ncbi:ABC transporter substrate-binding protein [Alkaliphilus peptidifermentans]|uniref:Iron complex transport system substrate-binding protein n=1 Tax=Alkaliphilus peptidifermentans DSM 18978 TaxID=1120976 RepID=A0A1G5K3A3_9FIRM|nr:cobalamin-binding protein [Alkaliphilus peptidifermentans]SCY94691.1 iron complex transport system substrate-binding protein [Alkaliphilus peptidifermentans DSM 18978]